MTFNDDRCPECKDYIDELLEDIQALRRSASFYRSAALCGERIQDDVDEKMRAILDRT